MERYGRISNPTVHIGLGQIRRLINEIIETHGKPHEIVVELARDLKNSKADREAIEQRQKAGQDQNDRLKDEMEQAGIPFSPDTLRKLKLWEEQGEPGNRVCPFTGRTISFAHVVSEETETEHLLPFSRSLDDSMANKVVAMRDANREKGNRTPFEAWGADQDRYAEIIARSATLPKNKAWRFLPDAMEQLEQREDFLGRHLNETRYLSKIVREYLGAVVPTDRINVVPGMLTALLRGKWGLNGILSDANIKERLDHRHHMIDAAVVGLTTRSMLQRVSHAAARSEGRLIDDMPEPWDGYFEEIRDKVRSTIVHYKPNHGTPGAGGTTSGQLHNETAYGIVDGPDPQGLYTLVETKPLTGLAPERLENVRDPMLRARLLGLWESVQADAGTGKQAWAEFVERAAKTLGVKKVRVLVRIKNLAIIQNRDGQPYKAYKTDGNAYMDVWLLPNGRTIGETVTLYEANRKQYFSHIKGEYPIARKLMRLHVNDMIAVGEGSSRRIMKVQTLSGQTIVAVDHNEGGNLRNRERTKDPALRYTPFRKSAGRVIQEGIRKISISPMGHILDGGPFQA